MPSLFNRVIEVQIRTVGPRGGGTSVTIPNDFAIDFDVTRSLDESANTASVTLYNLIPDTAAILSTLPGTDPNFKSYITINAGYRGQDMGEPQMFTIFKGQIQRGLVYLDETDLICELEATDGDVAQREVIRKGYGKNVRLERVVADLITALELGRSRVPALIRNATTSYDGKPGLAKTFPKGLALQGYAFEELQKIMDGFGLEISIQNNEIQVLEIGKPLSISQTVTQDSGLIGTTVLRAGNIVECSTLMLPNIFPGTKISLFDPNQSKTRKRINAITSQAYGVTQNGVTKANFAEAQGEFRVERASYTGNNRDGDFTINLEALAIKV